LKLRRIAIVCIGIIFGLFQLYAAGYRPLPAMQHRSVHLSMGLMLVFLVYSLINEEKYKSILLQKSGKALDLLCVALSAFVGIYIYTNYMDIAMRRGSPTDLDVFVAVVGVILVVEATRRVSGLPLPVLGVFFLLYVWFGKYLPVLFGHAGYSLKRAAEHMYLGTEGVLGTPLGVCATVIANFIIFGAFMEKSGTGQLLIDLALAVCGKMRGGAAKVAIIASSLMGMVSGSHVANVVTTGTMTIPMMIKGGYSPTFAAAVEAVASTGGQIMPPVMGAVAFIIPEILGVSYFDVLKAAILPALLYYVAAFIVVDLRAAKRGGLRIQEKMPSLKEVLRGRWHLLIPIFTLIIFLVFVRSTPSRAAFWATVAIPIMAAFSSRTRMSLQKIVDAMVAGAKTSLVVITATACSGIVIGVIDLTGLGLRMSSIIVTLTEGNLLALLILCALVCIILGMGLPPVACYLILAVMAAPAIVKAGVEPMAAHLFIFYFGIISAITPPVAMSVFAAAAIAESNAMRTGLEAVKLGLAGFIVPFMFVYCPELILSGDIGMIIISIITAVLGLYTLASALEGYVLGHIVSMPVRLVLGCFSLFLIIPGLLTDVIGLAAIAAVVFIVVRGKKGTVSQAV
jgi:TRAP transporter 4TM/12TM fusion protein